MHHDINLNIHYTAPNWVWERIGEVYKTMPYWNESGDCPNWVGTDIALNVSVEPGGIQIFGTMPGEIWKVWYPELKEKLTAALGYEIGEPEDGLDFKYDFEEDGKVGKK
ncbi:MAG: hypothetical protein K2O03_10740 [Lachnospiraceae bacterium]|nr:hypothetical protein [Lachnospiraceae bacterium]